MDQLPFKLSFIHKFNLHKLVGLIMDDNDLKSIARIYGVKLKEIKKLEAGFDTNISRLARNLKKKEIARTRPVIPMPRTRNWRLDHKRP